MLQDFKKFIDSVFIYNFLIKHLDKCSKSATGGTAGDGDGSGPGNCGTGKFCYNNLACSTTCSKSSSGVQVTGDGSGQGNCPTSTEFCYMTGSCSGM